MIYYYSDIGMQSYHCVGMTKLEMNVIGLRIKFNRIQMVFYFN